MAERRKHIINISLSFFSNFAKTFLRVFLIQAFFNGYIKETKIEFRFGINAANNLTFQMRLTRKEKVLERKEF